MQSIFSSAIIPLFRQFHYFAHLFHDAVIVLFPVGYQAIAAILDAVFKIGKVAAAFVAQGVQGAIAEQAVKVRFPDSFVAGKELTCPVLAEFIVFQFLYLRPGVTFRGLMGKFHLLSGFGMSKG